MILSRRVVKTSVAIGLCLTISVFLYFLWWALHGPPGMTASLHYERPSP